MILPPSSRYAPALPAFTTSADYAEAGLPAQIRAGFSADQLRQFLQAGDEQADSPGELHYPVGHAGLPRLVGVEGDEGVGRDLAHPRDEPLGVLERHGGDVHNGGLPECGFWQVLGLRSDLR